MKLLIEFKNGRTETYNVEFVSVVDKLENLEQSQSNFVQYLCFKLVGIHGMCDVKLSDIERLTVI